MTDTAAGATICTLCLSPIHAEEPETMCPTCHAHNHADCWQENGGCGVYGCAQTPPPEPRGDLEIPVSHWGQTHKACPACRKEIRAAAVMCKHCGTEFSTAGPQDYQAFTEQRTEAQKLPGVKKGTIFFFVLSAIPGLSILGLLFGVLWYPFQRKYLKQLPGMYHALCILAFILGALLTGGLILAVILYPIMTKAALAE